MRFLFDDEILPAINKIIKNASDRETIYLITPYLKLNDRVRQAVEIAANARADLYFITRRNVPDRSDDDIRWLLDKKVNVFELEFLHAKIYWSKSEAIVTSMNLHDGSDRSSREIAIVFDESDKIDELLKEIEKWMGSAIELKPSQLSAKISSDSQASRKKEERVIPSKPNAKNSLNAFCISGRETIEFNPESPLCATHSKTWAKNLDTFKGNYCHKCGKNEPNQRDFYHPVCRDCWENLGRPKYTKKKNL